jgi:photosystem II stability/assembly factor-like uncharacterized protein
MKKILYLIIFLTAVSFTASAQSKIVDMKKKFNFMQRFHQTQNFSNQNQKFSLKINPYWQDVDAPHTYNSFVPQIKVPCFNAVWAKIEYDSIGDNKHFLRTADGGKTWQFDTIPSPAGYVIGSIAAIDANTCYAAMYNAINGLGGGIFKTKNGGAAWKQIAPGKLFDANSYPDFVYFFDAKHGLAVGDHNGSDTATLEMYTTADAGATWQRVSKQNIPPTIGMAYSPGFNVYAAFGNRIWFKAYDSQNNLYLYRSDDLGQHWQLFPVNFKEFFFDFAFADKLNGLAVGFDFGVGSYEAETHDGGKTWAEKSFIGYPMGAFVTVIPFTHTFISTLPYGYAPVAGSSYSNDYGATWKLIDSGAAAVHSAVAFLNPFIGWTGRAETADPNGGMYKWKLHFSLGDNAIASNDENISSATKNNLSNTINVRLYPNPARDVLKIEGLNASAKTTLSLFNVSGKLIQQSILNGESYQLNIQKLSAGSYYVTIQSGEKITTLKFVKE